MLQAFSVDVSGALKNVHSSGQRQVSSQSQSNHTTVATTASLRKTGVETITQSSSQVTEACGTNTDTSDSKEVQINDTPRGRNSHVRDSCASQGEDCTTNVFQNVPNTDSSASTSSCAKDTCVSQEVRNTNKQNMTNRNASGARVLQKVPDTNKPLGKNCNASDSDILQETTDISGLYRTNHDISGDTVSRIIQNPRGLEGTYSDTCDTGVLQKITDKGKQNKKNRNAHGNNASHKVQNNVTDDSEEAYHYSSNACVSPEVEYFGEREGENDKAENDKASCAIHVNEEENSHDTEETRRIVSNSCSPQTVGDVRVDISESGQRSYEENEPKNDPGAPSLGDVVLSGSHLGLSHGVAGQPENGDSGCQDSIRLSATKQGRSPAGRHSKRKNYHNTENAKKKRRTSGGIKNKQGKRESCSEGEAVNELESTENTFGVMDVDVNNTNTEDVVNGRNKVDTIDNQLDSSLRSDKDSREKSLGNGMQQVEPSQRRYPIRSTRRHLQIDTDYVEPTVDARVEQVANSVLKPRNAQRGRRTAKVDTGKTRAEHMVRQNPKTDVEKGTAVVHGSDVRQVRVSMVPPLPPSATTLNAFKKLLTLRKDLKSQANSPKRLSEKQTVSQPEGIQRDVSQGSSGGKKVLQPTGRQTLTRIGNPLSDRLLVDSRESAGEEFRNSLPYQQLVNRFNGLFLWPGFLSIVNPNFSSKGGGAAPSPSKNARRDQLVSWKET